MFLPYCQIVTTGPVTNLHNQQRDQIVRHLYFAISIRINAYVRGHPKLAGTILTMVVAAAGAGASMFLPGTYATEASEWRSVSLSDNTVATFGPLTKVVVKYDDKQRLIRQLSGEATYQVAHDVHRPFRVECGAMTAQAVGTKFAVNCEPHASYVIVAEGTVSVFRGLEGRAHVAPVDHVRVEAGYRVQMGAGIPLIARPIDVDVALAWERERIFFNNTPVEEAIGEFNRRNKQQIPIPSNPRDTIIGEFDLSDPDKFVQHLQKTAPGQPSK